MSNDIAKGYVGEISAYIEINLKIEKLEQRLDEIERRQCEFMGMLRDFVSIVKKQSETIDAIVKP